MEKGCTFAPAFDRKRRVRQMRGSARTLKSMKQEIACVRLRCEEHWGLDARVKVTERNSYKVTERNSYNEEFDPGSG